MDGLSHHRPRCPEAKAAGMSEMDCAIASENDQAPAATGEGKRSFDRDDLPPTGEGQDVVTGGMSMASHALIVTLTGRRESMGLAVEEGARRSRPSVETVAGLEGRQLRNPPLDTLFRYAMALNALVTLGLEEIEEDDRAGER